MMNQLNIFGTVDVVRPSGHVEKNAGVGCYMPVTKWYCWDKDKERWTYNHYSEGWVCGDIPEPVNPTFSSQRSWNLKEWKSVKATLIGSEIIDVDTNYV